jgi:hypothetical protein
VNLNATIQGLSMNLKTEALAKIVTNANGAYVSGKIKITGSGSILYLTFLGGGNVKLELDGNSDGIIDATKTTTLTAIGS